MRVNQTRTKNGTLISLYETSRNSLFMGVSRYFRFVIPLGFKPKTFRTGICHSISLSIPLFMVIFGIPQNAFAPILRRFGIVNTLLSVAKVRISEQKAKIIMDFFE